jgi:hypothetical protein
VSFAGFLYRVAHPLDDKQAAGEYPAVLPHQRKGGHGQHIEDIARNGHEPVASGFISEPAENIAHGVAYQLAQT